MTDIEKFKSLFEELGIVCEVDKGMIGENTQILRPKSGMISGIYFDAQGRIIK